MRQLTRYTTLRHEEAATTLRRATYADIDYLICEDKMLMAYCHSAFLHFHATTPYARRCRLLLAALSKKRCHLRRDERNVNITDASDVECFATTVVTDGGDASDDSVMSLQAGVVTTGA